jgi:hypothetical protein
MYQVIEESKSAHGLRHPLILPVVLKMSIFHCMIAPTRRASMAILLGGRKQYR